MHHSQNLRLGVALQDPDTPVVLAEAVGNSRQSGDNLVDVGQGGGAAIGPGSLQTVEVGQDTVKHQLPLFLFGQQAEVSLCHVRQAFGGPVSAPLVKSAKDLHNSGVVVQHEASLVHFLGVQRSWQLQVLGKQLKLDLSCCCVVNTQGRYVASPFSGDGHQIVVKLLVNVSKVGT